MIITSDASTTGWGACLGDIITGGTWLAQEMMHHINYLEFLAAFLAVQCFLKTENNMTILLKLDNMLHQPDGRNSLQAFVPTSTYLVEMVHSEELVSDSRTSSESAECTDRPRIQEPEGSM